MALSKLDKTSEEHKMLETFIDDWAVVLRDLIDKVNTGFDKTNEHITKVASMQSEINTEKNKTGITQAQADAIVANTAKTGISTAQANAITANTAKVGITTKQTSQLNTLVQNAIALNSAVKNTTVSTPTLSLIPGKTSGTYSLRLSVTVTVTGQKAQVKYVDLPLT